MPYQQCRGADLYYEDVGNGPAIVFLHGVMASHQFFEPQLVDLAADFRTIGLDFRGHGRSEKVELGHTVAQYARDVRSLIEALDLEHVVLVGWSMGAFVSWDYVEQFTTDGVRGLVDIDMEASRFQWADYEHGLTDLRGIMDTMELVQRDYTGVIERVTEQVFKHPPTDALRSLQFDELSRIPPTTKSAILFDALTRDYREVLPDIDVPTLVCAGADEKRGTVEAVRQVTDYLPDADFELFEESGHCPTLEEPDRFNRTLRRFVDSL